MFIIWELFGGFVMGVANIIPGVSGGTMLLIMGLYERLVNSVSLFGGKNRDFFKRENLLFLFIMAIGILTGVFSTSKLMNYLIDNHSIPTYFFIIGLIIGSIDIITEKVDFRRKTSYIPIILGMALMLGISIAASNLNSSQQTGLFGTISEGDNALQKIVFFAGGIFGAIAMILPGISGSMLLVVFGLYSPMVKAVSDFDIISLIFVALGVVVGIMLVSKTINFMLKRHSNGLYSFILGLILASIYTIWPAKDIKMETASFIASLICISCGFIIGHYILKMENNFSDKKS